MEAGKGIKMEGKENDLLDRIAADPAFKLAKADLDKLFNTADFVGRAPQQVEEFVAEYVDPLLEESKKYGAVNKHEINV
jgi:adenylosuccinate lyase